MTERGPRSIGVRRELQARDFVVGRHVRLALAEAESAAVPMPSVGVVRDRMMAAIVRGYGELDWTALGLIAAEEAGARCAAP